MRKPSTPMLGPAWALRPKKIFARQVFTPYQVNPELMAHAAPDAVFHALPSGASRRGSHDEVLDGPHSVVLDQSENRMYVQKAILHALF